MHGVLIANIVDHLGQPEEVNKKDKQGATCFALIFFVERNQASDVYSKAEKKINTKFSNVVVKSALELHHSRRNHRTEMQDFNVFPLQLRLQQCTLTL